MESMQEIGHLLADVKEETFTYYDDELLPVDLKIASATTTYGGHIVSASEDLTGIMIWPATHLLCQHLIGPSTLKDQSIVELGCGCGLVGIAAAKSRHPPPKVWISTDMEERALGMCRRNFLLNEIGIDKPESKFHVRQLKWGDETRITELIDFLHRDCPTDGKKLFDLVIGADIVYPNTSGEILVNLFKTVDMLLSQEGEFWLSFATRDGHRTPQRLLEVASAANFKVSRFPSLDPEIAKLLPPMLDSKILVMTRSIHGRKENQALGAGDCTIFPGMQVAIELATETSSEESWVAPFGGIEDFP